MLYPPVEAARSLLQMTMVFFKVDSSVAAAIRAQKALVAMTLEQRGKIIEAIRKLSRDYAEDFLDVHLMKREWAV